MTGFVVQGHILNQNMKQICDPGAQNLESEGAKKSKYWENHL